MIEEDGMRNVKVQSAQLQEERKERISKRIDSIIFLASANIFLLSLLYVALSAWRGAV